MDKDPKLIIHTTDPVNAEPPLDELRENYITPQPLFYIRNHGDVPDINEADYRLKINGLVEQEMELSMAVIKNDFPKYTVMATLQCAGNRRVQLIEYAPVPGEVPWQEGAIGNATWSGARLKDVLMMAGVHADALYAEFMGAEDVIRHNENVGFGASIPITKALTNDVLLAYEMNGKPLEPTHGFPLRVVVPGYIGARSVKWLTRVTLITHPSKNYFQSHAYQLFPPHESAETVDWDSGIQLSELDVNCVITSPHAGDKIKAGAIQIKGYAMSGGGRTIKQVFVSADGGYTWTETVITEGDNKWAWAFWETTLSLEPGEHELLAYAIDSDNRTQPEEVKTVWNFKGYMNNAWHRIRITVEPVK